METLDNDFFADPCPTEIDNHADTHCFGRNFCPLYFTSEVCTVSPFLSEYDTQDDIPICTAATAVDTEDGETIILEFGQGLWFGNRMDRSLLNPNQCRHFGIQICDDPTDPARALGISVSDQYFVQMRMNGSTCGFISRCPTTQELETCQSFSLSDDASWDPHHIVFDPGKGTRYNISSMTANTLDNLWFRDDTMIHEFDRAMAQVSTSYVHGMLADQIVASVQIKSTYTDKRHHGVDANLIARKWGIGVQRARDTLKCTTQQNIRSAILPLTRRYRTDLLSQRLRRLSTRFYTDTIYAKHTSLQGHTCAQMFTDGEGFVVAFPISTKEDAGEALQMNCRDVGVPDELHFDNANEMCGHGTKFQLICRENKIKTSTTEPHSPWQNRCENIVGIVGTKAKGRRARRRAPKCVWDFGLVWECEIYSRTAAKHGRTGLERLTGDTVDISEWIEFEFYDLIRYWDTRDKDNKSSIGRWLGISHHIGSALCYWVLTNTGKVLSRTTVQHLTKDETANPEVQSEIREFHAELSQHIGTDQYDYDDSISDFVHDDIEAIDGNNLESDYMGLEPLLDTDDYVDNSDERLATDTYDQYVGAEISVPDRKGQSLMAKVTRKIKSADGNNTGNYNPLKDNSVYEVQFSDGNVEELTANVIAECMLSNINSDGHHFSLMNEIIDHKKDNSALTISQGYITSKNGNKTPKRTTRGWKFLVEWKDGSLDWIPLKDLKESFPIQVAEYALANELEEQPAFKWWVHKVLRRRDRMISKVKSKYWRTTHKFGIRIPKTVDEAYRIDRETGTDFWTKAIEKEMKNVRVAFQSLEGVSPEEMKKGKVKPGYSYCGTHMIFDIKMDGKFTRKARLVADGHLTKTPSSITYSSVVSRDSVRIALMIASLNDLDLFACDIGNAYLNADCREKLWTVAGSEFGSEKGTVMLIVRALYGLKSSGAAWRAALAQTLRDIGYTPSESDPDVWMKKGMKPCGQMYWKLMLVYVDDILHISHNPQEDMKAINQVYRLKDGAGSPDRYLGANVQKVQLADGSTAWSMTCVDYLKGVISNVNKNLEQAKTSLKNFGDGKRPYPSSYRPEIDVSRELDPEQTNYFQQLIGILRWSIELGRIDIYTEVSCISQFLCNPREGHLLAAYKIFRYLQVYLKRNPGRLVFDGSYQPIDERLFETSVTEPSEWIDFYPDASEAMPGKAIEPLGNPVCVRAYVDANHAGNLANRRSHSGILIYVNNAPILWYSKRQNTVESSSFGSEYVALRICTEMVEGLRYKLRTFGIPIDGPADIFCDNKSVVTNSSVPASVLNKRHNAICYHRVREAQAAGTIRVGWIEGKFNLADLFTKTTIAGNTRHGIVEGIFHNEAAPIDDGNNDTDA